jgi:hypothetical protein
VYKIIYKFGNLVKNVCMQFCVEFVCDILWWFVNKFYMGVLGGLSARRNTRLILNFVARANLNE